MATSDRPFKDRLFDARLAMARRERRTVEMAELARKVGVSPQSWSAWEAGTEPDYQRLPRIAEVLETTVGWLIAGEGPAPIGYVELPHDEDVGKMSHKAVTTDAGKKKGRQA